MTEENKIYSCIDCGTVNCDKGNKTYPKFCLSRQLPEEDREKAIQTYQEDEENQKAMKASAEIECDYYCQATRIEETIRWAKKMGAKKIGIATCVGLIKESRMLAELLREYGFEVYGISCKMGEIPKVDIGIPERCEKIGVHMCNPILQAQQLNKAKTDINIVMGLCVGHDSLFYKHSEALTTTLIAKDRVLGHNPIAAFHTMDTYYGKLHGLDI